MKAMNIQALAAELMDSGVPEKVTLALMLAAYLVGEDSHGKAIPVVVVIPDGAGNVGAAGVQGDPVETLSLLLSGVCGTAIQALSLDLAKTQQLLRDAWGEREHGMGAVGHRRGSTITRRPSGRRGRGKR